MSKWNRPMRKFRSAELQCRHCGGKLRYGRIGWEHVRRIGITDPTWHVAQP